MGGKAWARGRWAEKGLRPAVMSGLREGAHSDGNSLSECWGRREFGIKGARAQGGLRGEVGRDGEVWHGLASVRVPPGRYGRGCDQAGPPGAGA